VAVPVSIKVGDAIVGPTSFCALGRNGLAAALVRTGSHWEVEFAIHETALAYRVANDGVRTAEQGATNELWAVGEAKERPEGWG
jgi:hypothetical protein